MGLRWGEDFLWGVGVSVAGGEILEMGFGRVFSNVLELRYPIINLLRISGEWDNL